MLLVEGIFPQCRATRHSCFDAGGGGAAAAVLLLLRKRAQA